MNANSKNWSKLGKESPVFVDWPVRFVSMEIGLLVWRLGSLIQCYRGSEVLLLKLAHA